MMCTHHICIWKCSCDIENDRGKDGVKNFAEQIEDKVKRLYEAFPQQTMIHFNDMLKENTKQQNNLNNLICFKEFHKSDNRKVIDYCHYTGLFATLIMGT